MRSFRLKPLNPDRRFLLFGIYTLVAVVIWGYVLFPADSIKAVLANRVHLWNSDIRIQIGNLFPTLWPGIRITDVQIFQAGKKWMDWNAMSVRLNGFSLTDGSADWGVHGSDPAGRIDGVWTTEFGFSMTPKRFHMTISNFLLDKLPMLHERLNRQAFGILSADIQGQINGQALTATARVSLNDGKIGIDIPEMTIKQVLFQRIDADIDVTRDDLRLVRCAFKGPHLSGQLAGDIHLDRQPDQSRITLSGTAQIHHLLMTGLRFPSVAAMLNSRFPEGVPFRLTGILAKPRWDLGP
ncbi:MAG: type II secretion system protein GspN [Desulfatirhabdiaceae bacterium]